MTCGTQYYVHAEAGSNLDAAIPRPGWYASFAQQTASVEVAHLPCELLAIWPRVVEIHYGLGDSAFAPGSLVSDAVVDYESELQRYQTLLAGVWDIQRGERILDVGCGRGETTRQAARAAGSGHALGVDISPQMIASARDITRAEGPANVEFECGDAASYEFAPGEFDLVISRFGTMFFTNLLAGFSNIALALRGGGRLSMLVWREAELNEWTLAIRHALGGEGSPPAPSSTANAFSLGDRSFTAHVLTMAGLRKIAFREVSEPVYYGHDTAAALQWICGFANVKAALAQRSAAERSRTLELLSEIIAEHDSGEGIWFGSRAWIVSAQKP